MASKKQPSERAAVFFETTLEDCTTDWLADVSDTGTFVKANGVDWSRDANGIPDGWTIE